MPRSTNPFVRQVYFWWLIAPVLTALLVPAFCSDETLEIQPAEIELVEQCNRDVVAINESASNHFLSWFVATGIVKSSVSGSVHAEETGWTGYSRMGSLAHTWFTKFWKFVYRLIWRWTAFWPLYIAGVGGIALPCLIDGLVIRAKKRYEFGQYNPLAFNVAGTLFSLAVGWMVFVPMVPFALTAVFMMGFFLVLGLVGWFATSNFQRSA
jgi:hypothetical protein